jgi:hypothetical protein
MKCRLLLLLLLLANRGLGQTDTVLYNYLTSHRYEIRIEADSSVNFVSDAGAKMLDRAMKGKQLLAYAEGYNHYLQLHDDLKRMFVRYLIPRGLKYYFQEGARSWVVDVNVHMDDAVSLPPAYRRYSNYSPRYHREEKRQQSLPGNFEYAAVDFERASGFNYIMRLMRNTIEPDKLPALYRLVPYMQDSSYLRLSKGKFVAFYREQRDRFFSDSNSYKALLGSLYPHFRYLMSDPMPSSYNDNRNAMMAAHVLQMVGDAPAYEKYMLSIGNGHVAYRDGLRKTTIGVLQDSKQLKYKILLVGSYCDSCLLPGHNGGLKYIHDEVLESFRAAANARIILFDLTELPQAYSRLRVKSDLLVFMKRGY